jgi:hypothetical protein
MKKNDHYPIPAKDPYPDSPYIKERFGKQPPGKRVNTTFVSPRGDYQDYSPPYQPSYYNADGSLQSIEQAKASKHPSNTPPKGEPTGYSDDAYGAVATVPKRVGRKRK